MAQTRDESLPATPIQDCRLSVAKPLAPEEVRPGTFVAVLHEIIEWPSFFWCCDALVLAPDEPMRMRLLPYRDSTPFKVKAVCLPFVLVKTPLGERRTLDVRRCRLARLNRKFARQLWKSTAARKSVRA
jgi:hypothetical protein